MSELQLLLLADPLTELANCECIGARARLLLRRERPKVA